MTVHEHASLVFIRGFPRSHGDCVVHDLFGGSQNGGYFPQGTLPIEWDYPCEFPCFQRDEPLGSVQARRTAFGGSVARVTADAARSARRACLTAGIELADRFLVFEKPNQQMETYGFISIRWAVSGVLEVPQFCISSALSDQYRIKFGMQPHSTELLQAALTLKPAWLDVFGFCTSDERLFGAIEFTGTSLGELYQVHVFSTVSDRRLTVGDELWGWYTGKIGETQLQAKRLLAVVEKIPDLPVPKHNR